MLYVVQFFLETIYSRGLKFLQVIYESIYYDLTQGFFIHNFRDFRISDLVKNPEGTDI